MELGHELVLFLCDGAKFARKTVNDYCDHLEAWQLIITTFTITCVAIWLKNLVFGSDKPLWIRIRRSVINLALKVPFLKQKLDSELGKLKEDLLKSVHRGDTTKKFFRALPEEAKSKNEIIAIGETYKKMGKFDHFSGKISGCVYCPDSDKELTDLLNEIFHRYAYTNPLHADVFPETRKMEAEVVRMACSLFNGDEDSCGTMTTGGTESILLACLAYRNLAYSKGNYNPEMIIPVTAHAAFDKASEMFKIGLKHIPLDKNTMEVDLKAMKNAITANTCMLVGSACNFPHGVIDNIDEISKMGIKYGIPVHVDACLGGFIIAFMEEAGYNVKKFDFRLPGVTSISCDTHKYAFCPKGTSLIMYRNNKYLHGQYFAQTEWPGGIYATPTVSGSRSGCNIALTWATLLNYGRKNYVEFARKTVEVARKMAAELKKIEGIRLVGTPEVSVVAFTSDRYSAYELSDQLTARHWNINAMQYPIALHVACTINWTKEGILEQFISDIKEINSELLKKPPEKKTKTAVMYGMAASMPDPGLVNEAAFTFFDCCYSTPVFDQNDKSKN